MLRVMGESWHHLAGKQRRGSRWDLEDIMEKVMMNVKGQIGL